VLGATPVADPGQPVRLALAPPAPEQPVYAEAEAPAAVPVAAPVAQVALAQAPAPVEVASEGSTEAFAYAPPEHEDAFAVPAAVAVVDVPASVPSRKAETISGAQFAAAVSSLVKAPAAILKAVAPVASAPVRAFVPQKAVAKVRSSPGRYVVQIGAYRSAAQVEKAWSQAIRRYRFANAPMSTTVSIPGRGTFHRLAVSGFNSPIDAGKACQAIRGNGGTCFVRVSAGDAPVQWASRYNGRRA
jgi:hypothetical protein